MTLSLSFSTCLSLFQPWGSFVFNLGQPFSLQKVYPFNLPFQSLFVTLGLSFSTCLSLFQPWVSFLTLGNLFPMGLSFFQRWLSPFLPNLVFLFPILTSSFSNLGCLHVKPLHLSPNLGLLHFSLGCLLFNLVHLSFFAHVFFPPCLSVVQPCIIFSTWGIFFQPWVSVLELFFPLDPVCLFLNLASSSEPWMSPLALAGGRCFPARVRGEALCSPEPPLYGVTRKRWGSFDQAPILVTRLFSTLGVSFSILLAPFSTGPFEPLSVSFSFFCDLGSLAFNLRISFPTLDIFFSTLGNPYCTGLILSTSFFF